MWIFINMLKMMLAVSSICFWEIAHLKILQSDWPRAFWLISGNNIFPKYKIFGWAQQIIKIFIIEQIQWKLMNKFFFKFKETYFWPQKKERFIKSDCHAQLRQGFWEIQKKKAIQFQENSQAHVRREGWTDPIS